MAFWGQVEAPLLRGVFINSQRKHFSPAGGLMSVLIAFGSSLPVPLNWFQCCGWLVHIQMHLFNLCPAACCRKIISNEKKISWPSCLRLQTKSNDAAINAGLPTQFNSAGGPCGGRCTKRARPSAATTKKPLLPSAARHHAAAAGQIKSATSFSDLAWTQQQTTLLYVTQRVTL